MVVRLAFIAAGAAAALTLSACEVRDKGSNAAEATDGAADSPEVSGPATAPSLPAPAPEQRALGESDSQNGDFRLAVTEASRSNGVLTLKARVTSIAGESGRRRILYGSDADKTYLISGDQKYLMLKDNEGVPLTTADGYDPSFSRLGDSNAWWAKYPAPPPEVKSIGLHFQGFLPIENIPIADR